MTQFICKKNGKKIIYNLFFLILLTFKNCQSKIIPDIVKPWLQNILRSTKRHIIDSPWTWYILGGILLKHVYFIIKERKKNTPLEIKIAISKEKKEKEKNYLLIWKLQWTCPFQYVAFSTLVINAHISS